MKTDWTVRRSKVRSRTFGWEFTRVEYQRDANGSLWAVRWLYCFDTKEKAEAGLEHIRRVTQ